MPYLDLLDAGQPEWYGGIVVAESEESTLRCEAQRLHEAWLRDGANVSKRQAFAGALLAWGRYTRTPDAIAQAESLLDLASRP